MEFNTQIATTIEQSKKLLELGIKPETADMTHHYQGSVDYYELKDIAFTKVMHLRELTNKNPNLVEVVMIYMPRIFPLGRFID